MKKVLLGLTTTPNSDWRQKVDEIKEFDIKEIALFPTFLEKKEREELYSLLDKTDLKSIPHVHLRDDMEENELDYLAEKYNVQAFNVHGNEDAITKLGNSKYKDIVYVENQEEIDENFLKALNVFSGICLDVSHWKDKGVIQSKRGYDKFENLLNKHKIGCSHISAVVEEGFIYTHHRTKKKHKYYSLHYMRHLNELDYIKDFVKYLPEFVSIELENNFSQQIEVKKYLENIIKEYE